MQDLQSLTPQLVTLLGRDGALHQVLPMSLAGPITLKSPLPTLKLQLLSGRAGVQTHPCDPLGQARGRGGVSSESVERVLSRVEGHGRHIICSEGIWVPPLWSCQN